LLQAPLEDVMGDVPRGWATFFLAVAAALALTFLLSG